MNKEDEKLKNLVLFNLYCTDKELENLSPFGTVMILIAIVVVIVALFLQ